MKFRLLFLAMLIAIQLTSFNIYSSERHVKGSDWEPVIRSILYDLFGNGAVTPTSSPKLPDPNKN